MHTITLQRNHPQFQPALFYSVKTLLLLLSLMLYGCAKEPLYQQQSYVFGTLVEITIYGETETRAHELAAHVFADFDRMHRELHPWKPGTMAEINRVFTQSPARQKIDPTLIPVIQNATKLSLQSDGLFNPAIGKLVALWGFHNDDFKPVQPDPSAIATLVKAHPQMSDIVIEGSEVYSKNPAVQLDLGGYAKGYALDRAADYLRSEGVRGALVNIGGNVIAVGRKGQSAWRVGIQHPRQAGPLATVELNDGEAIGTSGDYQRYFMLDGKRYCHIIDPRTGYPVQGVQAVTVLISKGPMAGTLSDAASKPIFIEGAQRWDVAAHKMGVNMAMLVAENGEIHLTRALKKRLEFNDKALLLHESP